MVGKIHVSFLHVQIFEFISVYHRRKKGENGAIVRFPKLCQTFASYNRITFTTPVYLGAMSRGIENCTIAWAQIALDPKVLWRPLTCTTISIERRPDWLLVWHSQTNSTMVSFTYREMKPRYRWSSAQTVSSYYTLFLGQPRTHFVSAVHSIRRKNNCAT